MLLSRRWRGGLAGVALALVLSWAPPAGAGPDATRASLDRLQEILQVRVDEGALAVEDVLPLVLVSTVPRYEASEAWFATQAVGVVQGVFGADGVRLCEACMVPRTWVGDGALTWQAGPVGIDEVVRLDDLHRGHAEPARAAAWIDEHEGGVSARIVDLRTGRVLFAQNVDPGLVEHRNTRRTHALAEELERRARGDSLTQAFVDVAIYPGQHVSIDWTDQWGAENRNLSGLSISMFDPVVGIGGAHYHCLSPVNVLVGAKVLVSFPTAVVKALGEDGDVLDPLLTAVGVLRVPFGRSNYGVVLTASTNGQVGVGISLLNMSLIPVIP